MSERGPAFQLPVLPEFQPGGQGHTCAVRCKAGCCRYFSMHMKTPRTAREFDDLRWYLMHELTHVYKYKGRWFLLVLTRCTNLLPNNLCGIYETRPEICAEYDPRDCEFTGEVKYEAYFEDAPQLEAWLARRRAERRVATARTRTVSSRSRKKPARKPAPKRARSASRGARS